MPCDDELFIEDLLIVEEFHEGGSELEKLGRVASDKEVHDRLQEMFGTACSVLAHQVDEGLFVLLPALNWVAGGLRAEHAAHKHPVAVLSRETERGTELLELLK